MPNGIFYNMIYWTNANANVSADVSGTWPYVLGHKMMPSPVIRASCRFNAKALHLLADRGIVEKHYGYEIYFSYAVKCTWNRLKMYFSVVPLFLATLFSNEFIMPLIKCRPRLANGWVSRINLSLLSKKNLLNFILIGKHIILALGPNWRPGQWHIF